MEPLADLLRRLPVEDAVRADLGRRLREPARHYHGARHVALLWERHRHFGASLAMGAEPWDTRIACAIAFHDAVHDARRRDNEAASAALWRAARPRLDRAAVEWVAGTIEATADHLGAERPPGMPDADWSARLWLLDLDLTPIGEAPAEFARDTARLRLEHAHVPDAEWDAARLAFLRRLAAAPRLFRTPVLAETFDGPARTNLVRELAAERGPEPG